MINTAMISTAMITTVSYAQRISSFVLAKPKASALNEAHLPFHFISALFSLHHKLLSGISANLYSDDHHDGH